LWRSYIKNKQAMRNLLGSFHKAEQFLRERRAGSPLSERERRALAMRYSRFADFYVEHDPDSFRLIKGWLKELGFKLPTELTPNLRILSSVLGYENAVRLRATYRKLRSVGTPQ
jgi:hypothetical protein